MSIFNSLFGKKPKVEPYTVDTEFGRFTMEYYDKENTRPAYAYLGNITAENNEYFDGIDAELYCDNNNTFEMNNALAILKEVISESSKWAELVKDSVAHNYMDESGTIEVFSPEGGPERVSPEEFKSEMSILSIKIDDEESIGFGLIARYKGENAFGDHYIDVFFARDGSFIECN